MTRLKYLFSLFNVGLLVGAMFFFYGVYNYLDQKNINLLVLITPFWDFVIENGIWSLSILAAVMLLGWKIFGPKKKKVRPFLSSGIGGLIESIVGSSMLVVIFSVVALGALFAIIVVAGIADFATGGKVQQQIDTAVAIVKNEPLPKKAYNGAECDFERKLNARNNRIGTEWIAITLCKQNDQFLFFVPGGAVPEIDYRDKTGRVLTSRLVSDFVQIEHTWGKPGGMPNMYRLFIPQEPNGFTESTLDSVEFEIRTVSTGLIQTQHTIGKTVTRCDALWEELKNCEKVLFHTLEETHDRSTPSSGCPMADDIDKVSWTPLTDGYRYKAKNTGAVIYFYDLAPGESFSGFTCNP